ncbi:putative RNA-directed DNA polymerase from transposon X-element [Trichonephila clavipes]|nr:putative RNA-directed DNA polymerase from transposon X-element [Trichonephila clavipes]
MDIDILKAKRKSLRAAFSMCCNGISNRTETLSKNEVNALYKQLQDKFSRLETIQEEISDFLLTSHDLKDTYQEDFSKAEEYRDKFSQIFSILEASQEQEILVSEENNSVQKRKFKLPKLELRKFSGELKDYLAFWSQFEKIHMDATIAEEDKFQYLLQCLVLDSKAARLVSSFPPTKNNYLKAITQLKERFGRDELLVQIYVRDLLSIVMKNAAGRIKGDLSELYDLLESKLMVLESLGRTKEKFAEFLEPLVESCLPENVLRAWERSRSVEDSSPQDSARSLDKLLCFLRSEVQSEEMIKLARTGLGASRVSHPRSHPDEADCSTAAALVNFQDNSGRRNFRCIFCDKPHNSSECFSARKLPLEEKRKLLVQKHACFRCLKTGHVSRSCKYKVKCLSCDKNHYTIMCADKESAKSNDENTVVSSSVLSNQSVNETVYLQTLVLRIEHNGKELKIRTILDSGSQKSYISERVIKVLQLRPKSKQTVVHDTYAHSIEVLSQKKICGFVPKIVDIHTLQELKEKNITLSDLEAKEHDIELLLGADVIGNILTDNSLKLSSGVTVVQTKLGYTVIGKTNTIHNSLCNNVVSLHCANFTVTDLWNLDAIGITDPTEDAKRKHAHFDFLNQFKENLSVLPDGRYQLPLPFKFEKTQLPNKKSATFKRHQRMCQRIDEQNLLNEYEVVFRQWEDLQIIEEVPKTEVDNFGYYLPHRPVMKQASQTMKIRPVFDASARDKSQPSLNDCLNRGPNLIELIPDIIDRFRLYPIGLSHCRVVFGICSSPFQLSACIDHLLENSPARFDDVTQKLKHSFYVDNCVTGVTDIKEQESFINKAIEVMARGCFNLRGWESNVPGRYIFRSSGVTSLLGLLWDLDQDTLKCILSPTTLLPKVLLQEAWKLKLKWDDPLPENIQKNFRKWRDEIVYLEKVNIPRYVEINENSELHLFVDACKSSYGACVYIRTVTPLGVKIRLIRAKSRVAPLKTMTIPRLELMACCIGARLVHSVYAALDVPDLKIIAWSDSMVALWWLKNHGDWSVFVANRVNEINSLVPSQFWRHVPGELNPADLLSRDIYPRLFSDSLWWEGPSWLLEPPSNWPIDRLACETSEVEREKKESECLFTQRLIEYYHRQNCHAGTHILLGILRERFWIVRSRRVVRKIVRSCIRCKRYKCKSPNSEPVSLPGDRVNDAAVFEVVGVDLAGPLYVKGGQKSWTVLFTCATYRAVHLELTSSLSTDAFLLSLRRFIARRGRPRVIYFDNGTNFRGAHGELSGIDWEKVLKLATVQRIIWKFNPPTAGWWERLVRVLKELLRRTLGNAILTTEELQTVLCDCESVINSRPLTYLSENSDDLVPLSPTMFLVENRNLDVPDIVYRDTVNLRKRVRYRQKLLNDLRHRFRKEYLGLLIQNKNKKGPLLEERLGEIVLIGDDIKKRMHWPLAKVIRLISGKDGKIRTVELKTHTGTMLRPIQRVYPLEVQSTETPNDPLNDCTITNPISYISSDNLSDPNDSSNVLPRVSKYGRVIKVPEKLDLFNQVLHVFESK